MFLSTLKADPVDAMNFLLQWHALQPTRVSIFDYGRVVSALARLGKTVQLLELLTEMRSKGPKPNAVVYNTILDGLRRGKQYQRCEE